jgi:hypothetical protein
MTGQAWLNGGTFAHSAAGPPMVYFSAYSSGSGQVTAVGPTTTRFTVPPVSTYSVEKLEILRPPLFSRKSLLPKMAFTFLV